MFFSLCRGVIWIQFKLLKGDEKIDNIDKHKLIEKFIEKIKFTSAEGIVYVMGYLVNTNNYDAELWNKLIENLSNKEFSLESQRYATKLLSFPILPK